ncbi:MAG: FtsW/RodA/SpoVE family cell cycle protein [Myxococcota bacterium]
MSYSATAPLALDAKIPPLFVDHVTGLALGLAGAWLVARVPVAVLRRAALPAYGVSLVLLAATLAFGVEVNGAQRWLALPGLGFRFQPSELAKCATILAAAAWLARKDARRELSTRRSVETAALAIGPAGLLLLQPGPRQRGRAGRARRADAFVAGTPWPRFVLPGAAGVVLVGVYILNNDYAMRRVTGFLDPFREARGAGWQLVQSYVAFGQGSVFGQGFGNGRQKLAYPPRRRTPTSCFRSWPRSLGLLGVLVVIGSFAALCSWAPRRCRATDRFEMLLAFGMVSLLTVPAFLNASVVMGLVPTKGLTRPSSPAAGPPPRRELVSPSDCCSAWRGDTRAPLRPGCRTRSGGRMAARADERPERDLQLDSVGPGKEGP